MNIKARTDAELIDLTYYLSQYDFKIKYYPGKVNQEADCLRRNPVLDPFKNTEDFLTIVKLIYLKDIQHDQYKKPTIQRDRYLLTKSNEIYYKKTKKSRKIIISEELSKNLIVNVHQTY